MRLCTVRFRHLLRQYGQMIRLGEDAAEKQSGEYILDKQYVVSLSDKAFETAEAIVYDLNVLTDQRHLELYETIEAVRKRVRSLIAEKAALPGQGTEDSEEPEYRLLRAARAVLFPDASIVSPDDGSPTLYGIVGSSREAAGKALAELARSLAPLPSRGPAARCSAGPVPAVLDLTQQLAGSNHLFQAGNPTADSVPLREFLPAFSMPEFWEHERASGSVNVLLIALEDSMNATVFHGESFDLMDTHLSNASDSNYIYCRFSANPPGGAGDRSSRALLAAGILARLGFSVSRTALEVTGWSASQPIGETASKLRAVGRMAAYLFQASVAIRPEGNIDRFFQFHDS